MNATPDASAPFRSTACEHVVFAFALWTITTHVVVLARGNLFDLLLGFVLLAAIGAILSRRRRGDRPAMEASPLPDRRQSALFWLTATVVVILTLIAHRPDLDDTLYLNLAVSAADAPAEPIRQLDRQHAIARDIPIKRSSRLSSLGMLAAAISWLTGIPVIALFHLVLPPLAALLVLLANRELFRILIPRHWAFGVLAVVVFLIADGETHRSYGNFSFVRLHQGKAVMVSAFVPLVIAYAMELARRPTSRGWWRLAAVQIAAIGFSSSALIVAPVAAALGAVAGVFQAPSTGRLKTLAFSLLSSGYVLAMATWARWPLLTSALSSGGDAIPEPSVALREHLDLAWGDGRSTIVYAIVLVTAWIWCRTPLARRLCLVFPILVGLLFLNPWLAGGIAKYTIPEAVYWRVVWLLPLPAMAALTVVAPLTLRRFRDKPRIGYGLFFLLLAILPTLSQRSIFSRENGVEMRRPGLKAPAELEVSRRVADLVTGRPTVLAPEAVSAWLPTLHHHPYPLVSRFFYVNRSRFGDELEGRLALKRYISGRSAKPLTSRRLHEGLERYRVACVVLERSHRWREEIVEALAAADFERIDILLDHEIWLLRTAGRRL